MVELLSVRAHASTGGVLSGYMYHRNFGEAIVDAEAQIMWLVLQPPIGRHTVSPSQGW